LNFRFNEIFKEPLVFAGLFFHDHDIIKKGPYATSAMAYKNTVRVFVVAGSKPIRASYCMSALQAPLRNMHFPVWRMTSLSVGKRIPAAGIRTLTMQSGRRDCARLPNS
jgi:hypothetical protein